jgi:hypothetical protein
LKLGRLTEMAQRLLTSTAMRRWQVLDATNEHASSIAARWHLVAIGLASFILLSEPASARANGGGMMLPGEPVVGIPAGAALAGGVLLVEAIVGAEYRRVWISPPFALVNVGAGTALCAYVALTPLTYSDSKNIERYALATGGTLLVLHGVTSVLVHVLSPPPKAPEEDWSFAVDTDLRTKLGIGFSGSI